jgi:hypothetical protein
VRRDQVRSVRLVRAWRLIWSWRWAMSTRRPDVFGADQFGEFLDGEVLAAELW